MSDPRSVLAALHEELEAAIHFGRDTVDEIKAEIARYEKIVAADIRKIAHRDTVGTTAAVTPHARAKAYLAALRVERASATAPDRQRDIEAEIARVEAELAGADPAAPVERAVAEPDTEQAVAAPQAGRRRPSRS